MSAIDRYLVGSNRLLYYVNPMDDRNTRAPWGCLGALWMAGAGCLSWQVLHEFYWNTMRKMRVEAMRARDVVAD
ncbi:MAG: hypothetical protein ABSG65_35380 [Bryobacteraceae bacterium]